jgi:hypothetical protein
MSKLKRSYADRIGAPVSSLRFLFDGRRINDEDSPKSVRAHAAHTRARCSWKWKTTTSSKCTRSKLAATTSDADSVT